jgi:S-DNA-T family DNA segregation ATPase FtsK/SpoIIIE
MRLALTVVSPATRQLADVLLDADPATPVGEITAELNRFASHGSLAVSASARPTQPWAPLYIDYQVVPPHLSLAQSPLRDGSVISLGSPEGCVYPEPTGLIEIRVAGGPAAGAVHRLSLGEATIGSGQAVTVRLNDAQVPEFALRITVDRRGGCQVAAYEGAQGPSKASRCRAVQWQPGQQIAVGRTLLGLGPTSRRTRRCTPRGRCGH